MRGAGAKVDELECLALAEQAGSSKAANIILMCRLSYFSGLPPKILELNRKAFAHGRCA